MSEKDPTLKVLYQELQEAIDGLERIADKLEAVKRTLKRTEGKQTHAVQENSD